MAEAKKEEKSIEDTFGELDLLARKRPASTTGNGKAQRKGGLSLAGVALYYGYFPKGDIRFP